MCGALPWGSGQMSMETFGSYGAQQAPPKVPCSHEQRPEVRNEPQTDVIVPSLWGVQ